MYVTVENFIQVIILGIIEGITEFLPISSTGHLLLAEQWMGERSDVFNVVIQLGAIVAVLFIYWGRVAGMFLHVSQEGNRDYLLKLLAAFGITVVGGLVISKVGLKLPHNVEPIAWAVYIGSLVLFGAEYYLRHHKPIDDVTWTIAVAMGVAQLVAAIFPGSSRSAATIIIGMMLGQSRSAATEFAFILGIPTMFAASVFELIKARHELSMTNSGEMFDIAVGFIVSAVVAFVAVKWLINYIRTNTFLVFAWYRLVLGLALLTAVYCGWLK